MSRLHRRSWNLFAPLFLAGLVCGCAAEQMEEAPGGPSPQLGGRLEPGVEVSVRLWGEPADYVYEGKAGEVINLSVTSRTAGLDPSVRLLDPSESQEAFDDDSGGQGNALIRNHALRNSGEYTARIETDEDRPGEVAVLLSVGGNAEGTALPLGTNLP